MPPLMMFAPYRSKRSVFAPEVIKQNIFLHSPGSALTVTGFATRNQSYAINPTH